jgi:hypothetical protein
VKRKISNKNYKWPISTYKRYLTSSTIREMEIKTILRFCLKLSSIGLQSHYKVRAHLRGMRRGKTPKKLDSIHCPQCRESNADTLKWQRPIGEENQELEKRLVQE